MGLRLTLFALLALLLAGGLFLARLSPPESAAASVAAGPAGAGPADSGPADAPPAALELPQAPAPQADPEALVPAAVEATERRAAVVSAEQEPPAAAPASLLSVRVVDEAGDPIGAMGVQLLRPGGRKIARVETSAEDGIARFTHASLPDPTKQVSAGMLVRIEALLAGDPHMVVDERALAGEPIEFVVPRHGQVLVLVSDVDGSPFRGKGTVSLGLVQDDEALAVGIFGERRSSTKRDLADGRALFPVVALGGLLEARVSRTGVEVETTLVTEGPTAPGAPLEVAIPWGSDHPVLRFRVRGADGAPLIATSLNVETVVDFSGFDDTTQSTLHTDAEGVLQVDLSTNWSEGSQRRLTLVRHEGRDSAGDLRAQLDLSYPLTPGLHELDDVVLAPPARFVAGTVVDESGSPISGADVTLEVAESAGAGGVTSWSRRREFSLSTDAQGRFEAYGKQPGERFRLTASQEGLIGSTFEFEAGAGNVVLELLPGAVVVGQLLVDAEIPLVGLQFELWPAARRTDAQALRSLQPKHVRTEVGSDGSLRAEGLVPGRYDAKVSAPRGMGTLWSLAGLEVLAGQELRDPRLDPVDLRGTLFAHVVRILYAEGEADATGSLSFAPAGSEDFTRGHYFRGSEQTLVLTAQRIDLCFEARGYRAARLFDVGGEIEIELAPAPLVRLRIAGDFTPPEAPFFVRPVLAPLGGPPSSAFDWDSPAIDARREVVIPAPEPGPCEVRWLVQRLGSSIGVGRIVDSLGHRVDVADSSGEQVLSIELTQAQLDEILGEFQ